MEVDIPRGPLLSTERAGTASFALIWNGTTAVWTLSALAAGSIIGAAFSLPFWFAGLRFPSAAMPAAGCSNMVTNIVWPWVDMNAFMALEPAIVNIAPAGSLMRGVNLHKVRS